MTMQQIEAEIKKEFDGFYASRNLLKIPDRFYDVFKEALMINSPSKFKMPTKFIKNILSKRPTDLTNQEVRLILNVCFDCPLEIYGNNFNEAIDKLEEFDTLSTSLNRVLGKKEAELNQKKATMISLAGIDIKAKSAKLYQA